MDYLQYLAKMMLLETWVFIVLNLVINGLPSIPDTKDNILTKYYVLNLVINGLPSILKDI